MQATPLPQPNQVEMSPEPKLKELDFPEHIQDLTDVPEEILLDIYYQFTSQLTVIQLRYYF